MKLQYLLRRSLAYLIDCSIAYAVAMVVIQWLILRPVRGYIGIDDDWFRDALHMEFYVFITISLPVWLYFAFMDRSVKGTLGKRLARLKVTNEDTTTGIGFWKSLARAILKLLPWELAHLGVIFPTPLYFSDNPEIRTITFIGLALFVAYFISIILDRHGQSLYDKLLKTKVTTNKNKTATSNP